LYKWVLIWGKEKNWANVHSTYSYTQSVHYIILSTDLLDRWEMRNNKYNIEALTQKLLKINIIWGM
jgi:hypothetical protein